MVRSGSYFHNAAFNRFSWQFDISQGCMRAVKNPLMRFAITRSSRRDLHPLHSTYRKAPAQHNSQTSQCIPLQQRAIKINYATHLAAETSAVAAYKYLRLIAFRQSEKS
jgi:hypothetical protein